MCIVIHVHVLYMCVVIHVHVLYMCIVIHVHVLYMCIVIHVHVLYMCVVIHVHVLYMCVAAACICVVCLWLRGRSNCGMWGYWWWAKVKSSQLVYCTSKV